MKIVKGHKLDPKYSGWLSLMGEPFDLLKCDLRAGDYFCPRVKDQRKRWNHPYSQMPKHLKVTISLCAWNSI